MDAMVTARVPVEIKEQGTNALRRINATTTDLVNAAYEYLLDTGSLPKSQPQVANSSARVLDQELLATLGNDLKGMSVSMADDQKSKSFKELKDELWGERYAHFA